MRILTDTDLVQNLKSSKPIIENLQFDSAATSVDSPIQPCSVDLSAAEIFLPFKKGIDASEIDPDKVSRRKKHTLNVGESVKVSTKERLKLDNYHCGLITIPARISRRGIIVPDVGHIDPGFEGELRLTFMNMGRDPFELKAGDKIATILLFELGDPVGVGLKDRQGLQPYDSSLTDIVHLSADFLGIKNTVEKEASAAVKRVTGEAGFRWAFIRWGIPIILGFVGAFFGYYLMFDDRLVALETDTRILTQGADTNELGGRIAALEAELKRSKDIENVSERLDRMEQRIAELDKN